ncbi:PilW family protein [Rhodoferax saidenbachensis]|uniref:Type IV pilus assembly protein PilW n=1 Tax=Rhodoferax saidenbachensis TaxID=1484693 RepID=A0ABU1ZSG0_9BURK|nr:PilW family protein [Rhodoferax saidenbachensis]MDR7308423.1 type IV pilus assembly protein PilW [Rhodoferax saidenbachensis]
MSNLKLRVRNDQFGVTLIELMISIALGLGVLLAMSAVYVAAKQSFRFQETAGRLQEDATFALESISKDLRMAGFAGCRGVDGLIVSSVLTYYPQLSLSSASPDGINGPNPMATVFPSEAMVTMQPLSPSNFLRGFDGSTFPTTMFALAAQPITVGADSLFFSSGGANAVSLTSAQTFSDEVLTIGSDPFGWHNATANGGVYTMIVSDCAKSSIFAAKTAASGLQISHAAALGNTADTFPSNAMYGTDALVMPVEWSFYYIATRSGADTPSLYRVTFDGNARKNAEELVANVEGMRIHYGENLNGVDSATSSSCILSSGGATCVATLQADVWRTSAASVTNWSRVVAVRIGLMMVSDDSRANIDVTPASPTLLGLSYTLPTGALSTRLRKEFSTTVVLRNRVAPR